MFPPPISQCRSLVIRCASTIPPIFHDERSIRAPFVLGEYTVVCGGGGGGGGQVIDT